MKVIFLDFDGVLNSEGSFQLEERKRKEWKLQGIKGPINETFGEIHASNAQLILDRFPEVKVVISSTWREIFSLDWIRAKFDSYHLDSTRIIDKTPVDNVFGGNRGMEIKQWLDAHPEVTQFIVIDDNDWGITQIHGSAFFVKTEWEDGLTWSKAQEAIEKLSTKYKAIVDIVKEEIKKE